jgi:hypothetical protein
MPKEVKQMYYVDITMFLYTDLVSRLMGMTFAWFLGFDV